MVKSNMSQHDIIKNESFKTPQSYKSDWKAIQIQLIDDSKMVKSSRSYVHLSVTQKHLKAITNNKYKHLIENTITFHG